MTTDWRRRRRPEAGRPDRYVLTSPEGVPFEQDGLRDGEHLREWMTERFREVLDESGVEWIEVGGGREERVEWAAIVATGCW